MVNTFKRYVDSTPQELNSRKKYGDPFEKDLTEADGPIDRRVIDPTIERIKELLKSDGKEKIKGEPFRQLQRELVYKYVLFKEPFQPYLEIAKAFADNLRELFDEGIRPFEDENAWQEAIGLMKDHLANGPKRIYHTEIYNLRNDHTKDYDIAASTLALVNRFNCRAEIDEQGTLYIASGIEKITNYIEAKLKKIGGLTLIDHIFNYLSSNGFFNDTLKRYFIGRNTGFGPGGTIPNDPLGYLLNLAVKYPYRKPNSNISNEMLVDIITTSTVLCNAVFQSQHYSIWELVFNKGDRLPYFIRDVCIYDSIYSFDQGNLTREISNLKVLFKFVPNEEFIRLCGFPLASLIKVISQIDIASKETHLPIIINKSVIGKRLGLKKTEITAIFKAMAHEPNAINSRYSIPSDYNSINFESKPLIKLASNLYLFINRTWCAKAFYESVAGKLRVRDNFDIDLGLELETSIKAICEEKGITFSCGDYKQSKVEGECDLIIETANSIVLFEIKKKVLTSKSKSGFDTEIVLDLGETLLRSQTQAQRTELLLLKDKAINLVDKKGSKKFVLEYKDRRIFRVSVSHLDFRGFHDRLFITSFLETLLVHGLKPKSDEKKIVERFETFEKSRIKLVKNFDEFSKYYPNHNHLPYFNSSFLNLDQLLLILEMSSSNEEFVKYLNSTLHVNATGSLDFYKEFFVANAMAKPPSTPEILPEMPSAHK